jgi:Fe2+ transport system protein B
LKEIPQGKLFFPQSRIEAENGRQEEEEMEATLSQQHGGATLDQRIDRMHARDRAGLVIFIAVLWCTMLFALFSVWSYISIPAIRVILSVACALVLAFNTAAIVAMLRHYVEDKHFIYGLDIKHLDEMRRRRT